jgi:hypothetical protein
MQTRHINLYDLLIDEACLPEDALQHIIGDDRQTLELFSYDFTMERLSNHPEDYDFSITPDWVAGAACQVVIPMLITRDVTPYNILAIYRVVHTHESNWQHENLGCFISEHLRKRC